MTDWTMLADELAAFVLSASCAGCDAPATLLCDHCRDQLVARPVHSMTPDGMPVVAALAFDGVAARCIRRVKEEGETLLARPLGAALAAVSASALDEHPQSLLVPVPTSGAAFRRRGYRVPELLMRRAGLVPSRLLASARRTADQRELDLEQRRRNVAGSMRVRHARGIRDVIVFDDVVTTGATLDEGARALEHAGFRVCGAVVLAATPRHRGL
ncbi:ComF family protein [Microbacterium sp.]|uniref:ComF family protein n=1 Tax=Microbacterium sp. TaxID=51671 RepID=UPI003F9789DB